MTRTASALLIIIAATAACADKGGEAAPDDSVAAIAPEIPRNPRVMAIDVGYAVDSLGRIVGGTYETTQIADTIFVSVRTQYTPAGIPVEVRLNQGSRTIESVRADTGTPDEQEIGRVTLTLPAGATMTPGSYQVEVLLDGISQGARPLTMTS